MAFDIKAHIPKIHFALLMIAGAVVLWYFFRNQIETPTSALGEIESPESYGAVEPLAGLQAVQPRVAGDNLTQNVPVFLGPQPPDPNQDYFTAGQMDLTLGPDANDSFWNSYSVVQPVGEA